VFFQYGVYPHFFAGYEIALEEVYALLGIYICASKHCRGSKRTSSRSCACWCYWLLMNCRRLHTNWIWVVLFVVFLNRQPSRLAIDHTTNPRTCCPVPLIRESLSPGASTIPTSTVRHQSSLLVSETWLACQCPSARHPPPFALTSDELSRKTAISCTLGTSTAARKSRTISPVFSFVWPLHCTGLLTSPTPSVNPTRR